MEWPEDLLQVIFTNFIPVKREEAYQSTATLRAVCLVSKQCLRIAQPLLYHSLFLNPWLSSFRIKPLASKLAQFPRLASYVRIIHLDTWEDRNADDDALVPLEQSVADFFELAVESLRSYLGDHVNRLLIAVKEGRMDACLAFLLAQCQNIEELDMEIPDSFRHSQVSAVLHLLATNGKYHPLGRTNPRPVLIVGWPRLRDLSIRPWDDESAVFIRDIEGILCKSSLGVWRGHAVILTGSDDQLSLTVEPWPMRRVTLTNSMMDASGLERLLKCCSRLEHLDIEYGDACVSDECEVRLNEIGLALRRYGQGLQTISLDMRKAYECGYEDDEDQRPFGDLKPLTRLRSLAVSSEALIGAIDPDSDVEDDKDDECEQARILVETLPPSLQSLKVQQSVRDSDNTLLDNELFEVMASDKFAKLQSVQLERKTPFSHREGLSSIGWSDSNSFNSLVILERQMNIAAA